MCDRVKNDVRVVIVYPDGKTERFIVDVRDLMVTNGITSVRIKSGFRIFPPGVQVRRYRI